MIRFLALALARHLAAWAVRLTPAAERDWALAMRGELHAIVHPWARLAWAVSGLVAALRIRAATSEGRFDLLCAALLASLTILDWSSADPAPTLVALAAIPFLLAYARPERRWPLGLCFGLWLFLTHWLADWSVHLRPPYQRLPLSANELVEIALLSAMALPAAWLGAWLGRRRPPAY